MTRFLLSLCIACGLVSAGCRGVDSSLMPMNKGKVWNYSVKSGFNSYVEPTKVLREISAANTLGYELSGPLGTSRLAWTDGGLLAEKLNDAQFIPPLPLVGPEDGPKHRTWSGRIEFVDRATPASATQKQEADDEVLYGTTKVHTVRSTITMKAGKGTIELITWFAPNIGIVQQEQRTDGTLVVRLTLLDK